MRINKKFVVVSLLVSSFFGVFFLQNSAHAASFSVTNTNNSGSGSLRQAIINANSTTASDTISFAIGSGAASIIPTSALPPIIYPVTLDATTQPGYAGSPLIQLSGNGAGSGARGLYITGAASGSSVKGFIINKFSAQGIFIDTSSVTVQSNYIGTTANGASGAGNGDDGIGIFSGTSAASANSNIIGGTTASVRNVVSGNGGNGIGVTAQDGGTANNTIIGGNFVGTNVDGTGSIGNIGDGILINNAKGAGTQQGTIIGGTVNVTPNGACTGACNLISGNGANGIGLWHIGVKSSVVESNYVGTNVSGTSSIPNNNIGIEVNETPNNTVGGTTPSTRNVFSGNGGSGVFLTGASSTGNVIQGNYIGTNSSGTSAVANQKMGVGIGASPGAVGANSNIIGGTSGITNGGACTGACNLISGNHDNGIFITGSESYGHKIIGNYIGTNATGTYGIGNGLDGIGILSTPNTLIGGDTDTARNIISSNGGNGVIIVGGGSTGNVVQSNYIGKNTSGGSSGNQYSGIAVSSAQYNQFYSNSISYNGLLGIDLDNNGSTNTNDLGDSDNGANHLQNYPVVYAAKTINGITKIGGQFNSTPNSSARLEFFVSDSCNAGAPNDFGEGQTYIGYKDVATDKFGNTAFGYTTPSAIAGNKYITATATVSDTSEFSQCVLVNASKPALTNGATWYLKTGLTPGPADYTFGYGFPTYFLLCAWDPNQPGVKLPVIYQGGAWYMRASYTTGTADLSFNYGGTSGAAPVCGDWDGDGTDSVGVFTGNTWSLRNENSSGAANAGQFQFGPTPSTPVVGDWDGNGTDTIGVVSSNKTWYLRNTNSSGSPDVSFQYGSAGTTPVVGDWDGNGTDTIGVVSPGGTWQIRNENSNGSPNGSFQYGFNGATPIVW